MSCFRWILFVSFVLLSFNCGCSAGDVDPVPSPAYSLKQARKQPTFLGEAQVSPESFNWNDTRLMLDGCWLESVKVRHQRGVSLKDFKRLCFKLKNPEDPRWKDPLTEFRLLDDSNSSIRIGADGMGRWFDTPVVIHTINFHTSSLPRTVAIRLLDSDHKTVKTDQTLVITLPQLPD